MNQPLIVTVDSSKGIAKMSGPLTLGNSYKVGYAGLTEEEARPTERDQETGEVTYQGTQVVLLGIPQLTDEWETANPETRIAAITDDNDVLALTTTELVEAFKAAPPAPMPPVPPRDPRRPAQPMGMALHGTARPHGAVRLHFYVTAGGATLAQGDCTLNWAPFEFDGAGNPVVLQGPKGDKGEQGEQGPRGERGADAVIYTSTGCITFQVCHDENAVDGNGDSLYGHLIAYADNDYELYHGGDTTKPHFILGTGSGSGGNGMTAGHLFYIYYPADPATAPSSIDLGSVRGPQGPTDSGAVFAATLKSELEQNAGEMAAWNLNTAIHLANAIKNAIFAATGQVTALLLAFVLPFLFGGTAHAQLARTRSARASARGAIIRALRTQQAIHGQWTMIEQSGVIVNTGVDGSDGNLTRTEGATLSTNVPPCNFVDGEPQGHSLAFAAINNVAAAESANEYDPLAGAEAFTICAWVRRTSREGMGTAQRIVSDVDGRTSASGVNGFEFRFSGKSGKLHLRLNGEDITSSTATVAPDDDAWHHVAVSYDGTRSGEGTATGNKHVHFYLDAVQKGNGNVAAMGEVLTNGVPLTLGNSSAGRELSGILNGEMDNVFVIRDWSPAPPGNGRVSTAIDTLMRINDYDDEPGWDPEPDVPEPDHEYDIGEAEPLGDMHPTNTLYTAAQIDALLATVGANADWLEVVGNLASNALPASWADTPYFSGLEVEGGVQAGEFILDGTTWTSFPDTNAIVAAAVEAGATNFYRLDATSFALNANEAFFGEDAGYVDFGDGAREAVFAQGAGLAYFGTDSAGFNAATSIVYATSITLNGETRTNWPTGGGGGGGIANLESGQGILLSTNAETDAVRVGVDPNADISIHSVTSMFARVLGDVRVDGNLNVYGVENINTVRNYTTNVYVGVVTNYQTEAHYQTNNVYEYTYIIERVTNYVDEVVNVGGDVDYSAAASITSPVYSVDNSNTNSPALYASGAWDMHSAHVMDGCYFYPYEKEPDTSGTNSFSTADYLVQSLDLSGEESAEVCWNKPETSPYAFMQCRIRISTATNSAVVTWCTNNLIGFDPTKVSTNGLWSWIQVESYPNSSSFSTVAQWTETK